MIVEEARKWIGTPYHHQQRLKGVGVDCVGLVIGVGLECDILPSYSEDLFKPFSGYSRTPNPNKIIKALNLFMKPIDKNEACAGDVGWIAYRDSLPMHLAIYTGLDNVFIHSCAIAGKVVENIINDEVTSWWRFPDV